MLKYKCQYLDHNSRQVVEVIQSPKEDNFVTSVTNSGTLVEVGIVLEALSREEGLGKARAGCLPLEEVILVPQLLEEMPIVVT